MKRAAETDATFQSLCALLVEELGASDGEDLPMHLWERALLGPAREFLRRPGKQFRARLVEICWDLAGGRAGAMPRELPLVVELLHAGSLIVDDIEDGSATRRGAPALHHIYGTPIALNTGNWMYFWPFTLLERVGLPDGCRAEIHRRAGRTMLLCHQGQALDLALKIGELEQPEVPRVVRTSTRLKTGALMELAAVVGAMAAGAGGREVEAVAEFGRELGVGLQMLDDLGGLTCASRQHKGAEDLRLGRPTWPWAWAAIHAAPKRFAGLQEEARQVSAGAAPDALARGLDALVGDIGRESVHISLSRSLTVLREALGPSPALEGLGQEIQRLEHSYG